MAVNDKLVSIGLPTRNQAKFLKRSLDLLLFQTYSNFEIIISDNASSDETQSVCEEYARKDVRIQYFRQERNLGEGAAHNFDFVRRKAQGEYFMWAADDWWHPKFIETLKTILDENPDYDVAMSSFGFDAQDKEYWFMGERNLTLLNNFELFYHLVSMAGKNKDNMVIYGLWRREFLENFFNRHFVPLPPYVFSERVFLAEIALCTKFYTIPDILFKKFIPEEQMRPRTGFIRYIASVLVHTLTSRHVSFLQKLKVFAHFPKLLYDTRQLIFRK